MNENRAVKARLFCVNFSYYFNKFIVDIENG